MTLSGHARRDPAFYTLKALAFFALRISRCAISDQLKDTNAPRKNSTLTAQKYQAQPSLARDIGGGSARKMKDCEEASGLSEPKEENPISLWQNRGEPQKFK